MASAKVRVLIKVAQIIKLLQFGKSAPKSRLPKMFNRWPGLNAVKLLTVLKMRKKGVQYFDDGLTPYSLWRLFPICLKYKTVFLVKVNDSCYRHFGDAWRWASLWTAQGLGTSYISGHG